MSFFWVQHFLVPSVTSHIIFLNLHNITERSSLKSNSNSCSVAKLWLTFRDPADCSAPGFSVLPSLRVCPIYRMLSYVLPLLCLTGFILLDSLRLKKVEWLALGRTQLEPSLNLVTSNPVSFLWPQTQCSFHGRMLSSDSYHSLLCVAGTRVNVMSEACFVLKGRVNALFLLWP